MLFITIDFLLKLCNFINFVLLTIGSCKKISSMDRIAYILATENMQLISVDFWKSYTLSPNGLRFLINLRHLEEIDLGWWLV